jgi:hypothetical protein
MVAKNSAAVLVGDFRWCEPNFLVWFPAFGDRTTDAMSFSFHYANADESRIVFRHSGGDELVMVVVDHAGVADPDDYRVAWQIWHHVAPLRRKLIEEAYDELVTPNWSSQELSLAAS